MKTAVEWLVEQFEKWSHEGNFIPNKLIEQAKQMEKEQLKDAYDWGRADEKNKQEQIVAPQYDNADEFYQGEYGGVICG